MKLGYWALGFAALAAVAYAVYPADKEQPGTVAAAVMAAMDAAEPAKRDATAKPRQISAADVNGRWLGEIDLGGGTFVQFAFELSAVDGRLSGTASFPIGFGALQEGSIEGNRIKFATLHRQKATGQPIITQFSGEVTGSTIALDMKTDGGVTPIVVNRVRN